MRKTCHHHRNYENTYTTSAVLRKKEKKTSLIKNRTRNIQLSSLHRRNDLFVVRLGFLVHRHIFFSSAVNYPGHPNPGQASIDTLPVLYQYQVPIPLSLVTREECCLTVDRTSDLLISSLATDCARRPDKMIVVT